MRDSILKMIDRLILDNSKKFKDFDSLYKISETKISSNGGQSITIQFKIDYKSTSINFFFKCEKFPNGQYNIEKMIEPPTSSVTRGDIIDEMSSVILLCNHIKEIPNETLGSHMKYLLT